MNKALFAFAGVATSLMLGGAAVAATVGIGTTKGGATNLVAATIAKVVTLKGHMQMRTQVMGGTQQYIPVVNAGEIPFGVSNLPQYWMARTGTGMSKGTKYDNLRLAATLMPFRVGPTVAVRSGIKTLDDLKGKRVPYGFKAAPLFGFIMEAFLADGGLTYTDVKKVPAVGLPQHWRMFKEDKIDVVISAAGTGAVKEMDATVPGGVRYISLDTSPAAVKRMLAIYPRSYISEVKPAKGLTGVLEPVQMLFYDYMVWGNKDVPNETMYDVVKTMYQNAQDLKETSPIWHPFNRENMAKDQGTPYHPGAVKFYKEAGLMK